MPQPVDEQIKLDAKRYIVSRTDPKGVIEYGNDYFVEISGYKGSELVGQPHNIIRHPDMPRIVFKMMWDRIKIVKTLWLWSKIWPRTGVTTGL